VRAMRAQLIVVGVLALSAILPSMAFAAEKNAVIDFETVSSPESPTGEGLIVDRVSSGAGMSGDAIDGHVGIFGDSPKATIVGNAALIFDATCTVDGAGGTPNDCTGNERTLWNPLLGNVLIMADNLDDDNNNGRVDDPNSSDLPNTVFDFDFATLATGTATVQSVDLMDIDSDEQPATIELFRNGASIGSVPVPSNGDNIATTVPVNIGPADAMKITLQGSGAIDHIRLSVTEADPEPQPEGCSYDFWRPHIDAWLKKKPVLKALVTLLRLRGGPWYTLAQETATGLLNANHPGIDYPLSDDGVLAIAKGALSARSPVAATAELRAHNNADCPLD
jgi:hypothetical protein